MRFLRCFRAGLALGAVAVLAPLAMAGCRPRPASDQPPIVLVTLEGLRPDVLARFGGSGELAPSLERFAAEADWQGRAVAMSGSPGPSLVAILSGLAPHQFAGWGSGRPRLPADLESLPEALRRVGYRTAGYREGDLVRHQVSLARGYDLYEPLNPRPRVLAALRTLRESRDFIWLHSSLPGGETLVLRDRFRDRLPSAPEPLPRRLRQGRGETTSEDDAARNALYASNVAQADLEIGALLAELREHGPWDRALVVVVGVTGWSPEISRSRGGDFDRAALEVPLLIKLPKARPARIAVAPNERASARRVFATLVEAAGGEALPAAGASLFRAASGGALSERFAGNGVNEFSLVDGNLRLVRTLRFAEPEPEWDAARSRAAGRGGAPTGDTTRRILRRVERAFERTSPYSGGEISLRLEHWPERGAAEPIEDPRRLAELAALLDRAYYAFLDEEMPPAAEEEARDVAR
jgi:arylsulfatase A-like enzyme